MPDKYQKKLLNIWKTFDAEYDDPENEFNQFARKYHPSVEEIKTQTHTFFTHYHKALIYLQNKDIRDQLIKSRIGSAGNLYGFSDYTYKTQSKNEKEMSLLKVKEVLDAHLCMDLFGIHLESTLEELLYRGSYDDQKKVFSAFFYQEKYGSIEKWLDTVWENNWKYNNDPSRTNSGWYPQVDSDERDKFKEMIWQDYEDTYGFLWLGLRSELTKEIKLLQEHISDQFKEEIKIRRKEVARIINIFMKQHDLVESKKEEFCKDINSHKKIKRILKEHCLIEPTFCHNTQTEKTWNREFVTEDLWKDLDLYEIYKKEMEEGELTRWESWF